MTSAVGLYQRLSLPVPWHPSTVPIPTIIYGAASAVGSFAIQLALLSNIHPLICVAGRGIPHVETLIDKSKGDVVLDYREGDEKLTQGLKEAAKRYGGKIRYAFDAISEKGSYNHISEVLDPLDGKITCVLPVKSDSTIPAGASQSWTMVGSVHEALDSDPWEKKAAVKTGNKEFGFVMFRLMGRGLAEGWFHGHPYEVVPGGLGGVETALKNLKDGKASAVKYVFKIGEE